MPKRHNSGNCALCGVWRESLHREHIVPKWRGGAEDDPTNIQWICANCHEEKTAEETRSEEYREKMREAQAKRTVTDSTRRLLSEAMRARAEDPEWIAVCSANGKRKRTEEERRKIGDTTRARMEDPAEREKLSETVTAKWQDPEYRATMLEAFSKRPPPPGRLHTDEAKAKMREHAKSRPPESEETKQKRIESLRAYHARKKQSEIDAFQLSILDTYAERHA